MVEAVLEQLDVFASTGPVALAVDDLHWADPLTLRALRSVARQLSGMRLVVFCTLRPGSHGLDVDRVVVDLLARGAEHVVLGPLGREDAVDLATQVAGVPVGPVLCEQVAGAGGNPLFVIELVRSLHEDGVLEVAGGRAETRRVSLPPTLRLIILRRLSRLSEDTLDVLRVASIVGSTFSVTELALVSDHGVAELLPALRADGAAGLLTDVGERLTFRHVLVRDALYFDLPSAVRMGLHREAGVKLGAAGGSLERAATHIALGAEPGDSEAVAWLRRGAASATSRAPATAVRLLERAREIVDPGDPLHDVIASELLEPLVLTGRLRDAEVVALDLLAGAPGPRLELVLAAAWRARGRSELAIQRRSTARAGGGRGDRT